MNYVGIVIDGVTGESLPGAHVYVMRANGPHGTTTDADGAYLLNAEPGESANVSYIGYASEIVPLPASQPEPFVHALRPVSVPLDEFEVIADGPIEPDTAAPPRRSAAGWIAFAIAAAIAAIVSRD